MLYIYKYNMLNPEIVISICNDKLSFDTRDKKNYFRKYIKKNDKNHIPTQLALLYANSIMNNNTIIAEPIVNRVVEKPTKPKVDTKQIKQLKEENKQLKEEIEQLKQQNLNRHSNWTEQNNELQKKNYILLNQKENLEYQVKEYEEKLKKYGWKPPKKDFNILDEEVEYSESDDEIQNELDRGLN